MEMRKLGVAFEPDNPLTALMENSDTGKIREDILDEKVLSAILEFRVELKQLKPVLESIRGVAAQIDTVFSLNLISRLREDGENPAVAIARQAGFQPRENVKMNVGLGRPLVLEG
jgi:hypothetical protein